MRIDLSRRKNTPLGNDGVITAVKRFVGFLALILIFYFVFIDSDEKFDCEESASASFGFGVANAQEDFEDPPCVVNIDDAATDREWASVTVDKLNATSRSVTTAWYYHDDGERREIQSGSDNSKAALDLMLEVGINGPDAGALKTHAEMKIAALMIDEDERSAVIIINNRNGPCYDDGGRGCWDVMPKVLFKKHRVAIWWKDKDGELQRRLFNGER
ncbi:DddA-like double-stranded DNA deaminase toxin [Actinosynnema sp. NPDC059335]|uniref:DddA-like double-stranded DNA deaminase toxin n=1 Tax=Actinosynnema sp. NPDC059335 TaxID=3346804 RepID=UPI00366FCEE2